MYILGKDSFSEGNCNKPCIYHTLVAKLLHFPISLLFPLGTPVLILAFPQMKV